MPERVEPIPRLKSFDAYEGLWIAARGDEVVHCATTMGELSLKLLASPSGGSGLVIQYVHPPSEIINMGWMSLPGAW